jgi:hypothetical protein
VRIGRTQNFLIDQLLVAANPFTVLLWVTGLFYFLVARDGKRYRPLGWMFVVPLAAGAVLEERAVASLAAGWARRVRGHTCGALAVGGALVGILAGNYGEAGAIDLYGPAHGLPKAISGINSYWARGYGDPPPRTLIVVGLSREFLERNFESCMLAGHVANRYGVENEETTRHPDAFVCGQPREPWLAFWKRFRYYG